jgi:very-short-patch-repair endonuclease
MGAECSPRDVDLAIAQLAGRQHGIVDRADLIRAGLARNGIRVRIERGMLHPLHRGVYAVGHRVLTRHGLWLAAVRAVGPGAVLSHHAAAALWRIRRLRVGAIDVTTGLKRRQRSTLKVHHTRLPADEITTVDGIPVTTVPRTLFDLAAVLDARQVERALNEADFLRLNDRLSLPDLLARHPGRPGAVNLRAALIARSAGATRTRSELEEQFIRLLDRHALPRPQTNVHVQVPGVGEVDCAWPDQRLVLELDSRAAHATHAAFEADRERDRLLQTAGWRTIRVTWRQLMDDRARLVADVRTLLAA